MGNFKQNIGKNIFIVSLAIGIFFVPRLSFADSNPQTSGSYIKTGAAKIMNGTPSTPPVAKGKTVFYHGNSIILGKSNQKTIVTGEFIVKYKNLANISASHGQHSLYLGHVKTAKTEILNSKLGLALVRFPKGRNISQTYRELSKDPNVEYVEPNYTVKAQFIPNDPYYGLQWGTQKIMAEAAWNIIDPARRAQVIIAVLDSGVNLHHEDLKDNLVPGFDFVGNDRNTNDILGHGTHVAGIIAAQTNNGIGVSGVAAGCKIMPIKVLDDQGDGNDADIIQGIKYATDHGAQVINMSLGGPGSSEAIQEAIDYAVKRGVNVVVAAGNENGSIDTPGNCKGVITVGAVDSDSKRASYSNFGPELDVVAPGTDILSTFIGNGPSGYTYFSGTSMATPYVSGEAALIKAVNPSLSPALVKEIIHQSATDLGAQGFDNYYGYGLINVNKAVNLAFKTISPNEFYNNLF